MLKIFDSHAHLNSHAYDEDRSEFLQGLKSQGVVGVVECATNANNIDRAVELSKASPLVFAAVGVYPHDSACYTDELEKKIAALYSENERVVAIGEAGLDYYYDGASHELQKHVLERQLCLCEELNAPITLHCRQATEDMLSILKRHRVKGVMHCYSGSAETAKELIKMGFYFGIGGSLTFKNNKKTPEAARIIPMERILLETDSPYLSPVPMRGSRNSPAYIKYVAEKLAEIKDVSPEQICNTALNNAYNFFNIKEDLQ